MKRFFILRVPEITGPQVAHLNPWIFPVPGVTVATTAATPVSVSQPCLAKRSRSCTPDPRQARSLRMLAGMGPLTLNKSEVMICAAISL